MKIDSRDIYEQMGNLFYAIAADQHVKPLEVAELKLLISKDWPPVNPEENRSNISDETHGILMTMDANEGSRLPAKRAFDEFSNFFNQHAEIFSNGTRQRIFDTAVEITKIFKADNPGQNIHLMALTEVLGIGKHRKA
jgi:hypothetical protein